MNDLKELTINTLGRQGDGVASTDSGDIYVPLTLPGEVVTAKVEGERGELVSVQSPSPDRVKPLCKHYTQCGGCSLQHLEQQAYLQWKQDIVKEAYAKSGIEITPEPVLSVPLNSRRRATMEIRRTKKTVQMGFHGRKSSDIVNVEECHILGDALLKQLPNLKILFGPLLSRKGVARLHMTATESGLDISIENINKDLDAHLRGELAENSRKFGVVRLTINGETLFMQTPPLLHFSDVAVEISPGGFLQAVAASEKKMTDLIVSSVKSAKKVADLFCGTGTFTFPLAKKAEVLAVEYDRRTLKQLKHAYDHNQGIKPVKTELRDLAREPLSAKELIGFDAVVFDPPRAGAKAQAEALAKSNVPTVVAVSCNPGTMARDVKILIDGGYKLQTLTPIDQFLFSSHVEAVAVLTR